MTRPLTPSPRPPPPRPTSPSRISISDARTSCATCATCDTSRASAAGSAPRTTAAARSPPTSAASSWAAPTPAAHQPPSVVSSGTVEIDGRKRRWSYLFVLLDRFEHRLGLGQLGGVLGRDGDELLEVGLRLFHLARRQVRQAARGVGRGAVRE